MLRETVESIKMVLENNSTELYDIFIKVNANTDGFWKMCIFIRADGTNNKRALISRIEILGQTIAHFIGEGLEVEKGDNYIKFK